MIHLEQVSRHYRKDGETVRALDGVSLDIPKGAFALLTGPSGSGKTTLIHIVAGLTRPTSGFVTVAGKRLNALSRRECAGLRAETVAVVFQMFHLVPYLTALENVLLPMLAKSGGDQRDAAERAGRLLEDLGLAHRARHRPEEMSAGERQRCALARALLHRPAVILADEPTGNLDPASADRVTSALSAAHAEGATILLATHQALDVVRPDIAFELCEGRLTVAKPQAIDQATKGVHFWARARHCVVVEIAAPNAAC